jgi:putative Mg2+ transporter-C (MgtC) family protein
LVAIGACVYVMTSYILTIGSATADPSRVLGQIVAGIGFLGAGVIMRDGVNIHGLNSAATIWCSAAVGALAGFRLLPEAFIGAGFVIISNFAIRPFAAYISKVATTKKYVKNGKILKIYVAEKNEASLRVKIMELLQKYPNLKVRSFQIAQTNLFIAATEISCELLYTNTTQEDFEQFFFEISKLPDIIKTQQDCIIANN